MGMPGTDRRTERRFIGAYNPACLLSLAGVVASAAAAILSMQGIISLGLVCLILAGLADLFDGVVARRLSLDKYEKEFGVQLDTVVDAVAFVAMPVVIGLSSVPMSWLVVMGSAWFVIAGVVRLAHFNTLSMRGADQSTHHRGLPVTYTALIFPLVFLLRDVLAAEDFQRLLGLSFALTGLAFVANVRVRKPYGRYYLLLPLLAAALIVYWSGQYIQVSGNT